MLKIKYISQSIFGSEIPSFSVCVGVGGGGWRGSSPLCSHRRDEGSSFCCEFITNVRVSVSQRQAGDCWYRSRAHVTVCGPFWVNRDTAGAESDNMNTVDEEKQSVSGGKQEEVISPEL